MTAAQERLDFGEAGRAMYDFFWSQFADWYIEAAKTRLYGGDAAVARSTRAVCPAARAPLHHLATCMPAISRALLLLQLHFTIAIYFSPDLSQDCSWAMRCRCR